MGTTFSTCPYCGQKVIKGATRCVGCSRILKTPAEQAVSIQRLRESKKRFDIGRLLEFIILLVVIGIIYYFFSDRIIGFIRGLLSA